MGLLGKVFKAAFAPINFLVIKPITSLLNALIDIPKPPSSIEIHGKQYNADLRINEAALGDVKTVAYGRYRDWPRYRAVPYRMFVAHCDQFNAYLHLTVGEVDVLSINIGETPITTFPGIETETLDPGEEMTLILPNVYTNPDATGLELIGGLLTETEPDGHVTVKVKETGTTTISVAGSSFSSDTDALFEDFLVGDVMYTYNAGANNGEYTVTAVLDDFGTIKVFPPPSTDTTQTDIGFFVRRRWVGGYWACPSGSQIEEGSIDIDFNALWDNDGTDYFKNVDFELQYIEGDDAGNTTGSWASVTSVDVVGSVGGAFTLSDNVRRPRRFTVGYTLPSAMRPQLRLSRASPENTDDEVSAATWVGLKGYIIPLAADDPAVDEDSTDMAISVRASGLLSAATSRAINYYGYRKIPVWDGSVWTDPEQSRNPVWAFADWVTDQSNAAITTDDLDVGELAALASFAEFNNDTFDGVFDSQVGLWEGAKTLLRVVRAKPIKDPLTGLYTVYRDEPATPVQLFCDGFNSRCGTDTIALPDADTVTGIQIKFTDPLLWQQRQGPLVGTDVDVREVEFMGCTTWAKAWEEAQYEYRDLYYRTQRVTLETEMEGLIPRHGKRVVVCSAAKGWGHSSEVIEGAGTTIRVWPAPVWTPGMDHYVYVQDVDGSPIGPINVTQGTDESYLILDTDPGITYRTGKSWKTLVAFGHDGDTDTDPDAPRIAIVMERKANGFRQASLDLLFDNPFVHADPGDPPDDPYALSGSIPDLTITGLTGDPVYSGVILEETGDPLLEETGDPFIEEDGVAGYAINLDWDDVSGATYYSLRWKKVSTTVWHAGYTGIASEATIAVPSTGEYNIHVKAYSGSYVGVEAKIFVTV